jgi:hypothetical protein
MEANGWTVRVEAVEDIAPVKQRYQVPPQLQSCHTAIVDGYVIEGHVPVNEIERLLAERPDVVGLTVPGMPIGSPGMEVDGIAAQPFDVLTFDAAGNTQVFASYNP